MTRRPALSEPDFAQQRAFIDAIRETPEDDARALIYADWLDDHGDATRADFIRTQCRLDATPRDSPLRGPLWSRAADLLKRHKAAWLGPWESARNTAEFRRGFLDVFRIGANFGVGLRDLAPNLSPYLDLARTIAFESTRLAEGLVPLLGQLPALRKLECVGCVRGSDLVAGLARWPADTRLSELTLRGSEVRTDGLATLGGLPWLANLRALDVRGNHFSHDALVSLLLSPGVRGLEALAISGTRQLTAGTLVPLLSRQLPHLKRLRVQGGRIGSDGLAALVAAPEFARFTSLELLSCGIGDEGAAVLARSARARGLTKLSLRDNQITHLGAYELAASPYLANLTCLDLGNNECGTDGVRAIAESPFLGNLVTLRLDSVRAGQNDAASVEPLLVPGRLPRLRDLVMSVPLAGLVDRFRERGVEISSGYHASWD